MSTGSQGCDAHTGAVDELGGSPAALLVHDASVLDDPGLVESATKAARLALANARMTDQALGRVDDVIASRRRLVEAADHQRRSLGAELQERVHGPLQCARSLIAATTSTEAQSTVLELDRAVAMAIAELDELLHGIHPLALTDGLRGAVRTLADRAPLPVEVDLASAELPAPVEAALYFVCAEALTNVAKHAEAGTATVHLSVADHAASIEIADDGTGGADPARGSGLRGLQDRVEALRGSLTLRSGSDGTVVVATIPVGD